MKNNKLTCFLYILMRDELTPEKVEEIIRDFVPNGNDTEMLYSNKQRAAYAAELAEKLAPMI